MVKLGFSAVALASLLTVSTFAADPDPTGGVYVRDSGVAVEKFALADRMEHLGEWGKAADIYQEMLAKQADRVIAAPNDPTRFQSVVAAVQDRLTHWNADALNVYRDRFGAEAQTLLDQSEAEHRDDGMDDLAGLHRVFARYFVTDAGKAAGLRLMSTDFENGDFASAVAIGNRLLTTHPQLLNDRPTTLFRTALAQHWNGDDAGANQNFADLKQNYPATLGNIRGTDVVLADALKAELARAPRQPIATPGESWMMPFGSADRARTPAVAGLAGARMFQVPIDDGLARSSGHPIRMAIAFRQQLLQSKERARLTGATIDIVPAVDRGELYFQDNAHVYAVSVESGQPLPGWQETYPGEAGGKYSINAWPMPLGQTCELCLTDDSVMAVMGLPDLHATAQTALMARSTRVVCLDRRSGREKWTVDPEHLPTEPGALRNLDFTGSPLIVGNSVYVLAHGGRGMQFQDCYIVCLDRSTGTYKWSTYLASASDTATMFEVQAVGEPPPSMPHLAYSSGRVFICTNVGALASVDSNDGSILWLDLYPRDTGELMHGADPRFWRQQRVSIGESDGKKPWSSNPVIVRDGKVFICPSDSDSLFVFDATSGATQQRVSLSYKPTLDDTGSAETADTFVGIAGDHGQWAVLASDRSLFCVDLAKYDASKGSDNLRWTESYAHPSDARAAAPQGNGQTGTGLGSAANVSSVANVDRWPDDSIRGRPFLTQDSVIVPLAWSLVSVSLKSGLMQSTFPPSGTWDTKYDGPGNVLLTPDHLIIAGASHVNVYADLNVATAKLDQAIAKAPNDPQLRLRYAEVLFAARRLDGPNGTIAKLDEASKLMASPEASANQQSLHTRLFNDAMNFALTADNANGDAAAPSSPAVVDALFDHAGDAASTPAEQVTYRLRRAEHFRRTNNPAAELSLYQQILLDPQYRSVTVAGGENGSGPASSIVRQQITDLLQRAGSELYQPYETAAAAKMDEVHPMQALAQRSAACVEIAESYPNSHAAQEALVTAAHDDETNGDPRAAAGVLRQFLTRYADSSQRIGVLESLARLYLQMPNRADRLSVAIGRLEQAQKIDGNAKLQGELKLPDGTMLSAVTFGEAAASLRRFQSAFETAALPDPQIPGWQAARAANLPVLPEPPASVIADVDELVDCVEPWTRHDRIVTFTAHRGVSVYTVGSAQPLFTANSVTDAPDHIAWINGNLLVWCPNRIMYIRADGSVDKTGNGGDGTVNGTVIWDAPLASLPTAQLASIGSGDNDPAADDSHPTGDSDVNDQIAVGQLQNQARMLHIGGVLNVRRIGNFGGMNVAGIAAVSAPTVETIDHLVPGMDRIVFSTSGVAAGAGANQPGNNGVGNNGLDWTPNVGSRLVCLSVSDGHVLWQTRLADHAVDHLVANDDFVAVRAANSSDIQMVAFDAGSGQPVWRPKLFSRENSDVAVPVNLALAEDGSLVYIMSDRVCCKDLFDPDMKLRFEKQVGRGNAVATFLGAVAPDQLVINDGNILILSDGGTYVRIYSLATGNPFSRGPNAEPLLATHVTNGTWNVHMRVVGNSLYIFGADRLAYYGLDHVDATWPPEDVDADQAVTIRDAIVTPANLVLMIAPVSHNSNAGNNFANAQAMIIAGQNGVTAAEEPPHKVTIRALSREVDQKGVESGIWTMSPRTINAPSGITDAAVVDGGIYYRDGNRQVHFLRGGLVH